jgi:hypothetical protein
MTIYRVYNGFMAACPVHVMVKAASEAEALTKAVAAKFITRDDKGRVVVEKVVFGEFEVEAQPFAG